MSIIETVLVFVGIPVLVFLIVIGLVFGGTTRRSKRYRPGRPFEFSPVWLLAAAPAHHGPSGSDRTAHEIGAAAERPALTKSATASAWEHPLAADPQHLTGGASDRW